MRTLEINLTNCNYKIHIERGIIDKISNYLDQNNRYFIITDDGVPFAYTKKLKEKLINCDVCVVPKGEKSKSLSIYKKVCKELLKHNYSKSDYIIALGGGVVGDLAGYVASTYKRWMKFINIPTTTLSMVDSSIGGKVALNFEGVKNMIGTYYHPECVLIDPNVLETLPKRHINNGLIEALKTGIIGDKELYELFLNNEQLNNIDEVIYRSLKVKASVVEKDEKELNLRKVLNFGHTFGHAYEAYFKMDEYLHGESVALGMLTICKNECYYDQLVKILSKMNIKTIPNVNEKMIRKYVGNDKKVSGDMIDIVVVHDIASPIIKSVLIDDVMEYLR